MDTRPQALVIGAGFTGCALAYDLAQRGFQVNVIDRGDIANGTSGRTHGLLHSGARYCASDPEAAIECRAENLILRKIAIGSIEPTGGLFAAFDDADMAYASGFEQAAQACGIPIERLTPPQALAMEPNLNTAVRCAYVVPDSSFDPLRLALQFAASARRLGATFSTFTELTGLISDGFGRITGADCWNRATGKRYAAPANVIINATGAWAGEICALAGISIGVLPTPGVMVAFDQRLVQRVINRLSPPGDGDILVPQRRMVLIGTTSYTASEVDYIPLIEDHIREMQARAELLVPGIAGARKRGVWVSARPLISAISSGRDQPRSFHVYDHAEDGRPGLFTITGGKATTCRLMAEKTADRVCQRLGINASCQTSFEPLSDYRAYYR